MNTQLITIITFLAFTFIACRVPSNPSSQSASTTPIYDPAVQEIIAKEVDHCFVWKVLLGVTLYDLIEKEANSQDDTVPVSEILPARTGRRIIDSIIRREGGRCSRRALFAPSCSIKTKNSNDEYQILEQYPLNVQIPNAYFSELTGITMTKDRAYLINSALQHYESKNYQYLKDRYPQSLWQPQWQQNLRIRVMWSYSKSETNHKSKYTATTTFGLCMLKKHASSISQKTIDLESYLYPSFAWNRAFTHKIIEYPQESLKQFIKTTDKNRR